MKIAVFPTPSPPLATGLPSVMVDELGLAPSVTVFPAVVIELLNERVPLTIGLIIVIGPVNAKLLLPVNVMPELRFTALPIVRVPVSALNCVRQIADQDNAYRSRAEWRVAAQLDTSARAGVDLDCRWAGVGVRAIDDEVIVVSYAVFVAKRDSEPGWPTASRDVAAESRCRVGDGIVHGERAGAGKVHIAGERSSRRCRCW